MGNYLYSLTKSIRNPAALRLSDYHIHVQTGDKKGAGTDANVYIILFDDKDRKSPDIRLDVLFRNDFERGNTDVFPCPKLSDFGKIAQIELWRDANGFCDDWYVDYVMVQHVSAGRQFYFPIHRWISAFQKYRIKENDCCLPQYDDQIERRKQELVDKKQTYEFTCHYNGIPCQVKSIPVDEQFSDDYKWDIVKKKMKMLAESAITKFIVDKWESIDDLKDMYKFKHFPVPKNAEGWETDEHFARQRLTGVNATMIRFCTKADDLPKSFNVTQELVAPFLEGKSMEEAASSNKLFYTDHKLLEGIPTIADTKICIPYALFYLKDDETLIPVAIQLFQIPDSPVFTPNDSHYTWLLAKMWYNNADAQVHQSVTHLGLTHLVMEGVVVCTHRNLSPSHPMFKLLAPHFLYLIAINTRALNTLIAESGWISKTLSIGRVGTFELVKKSFADWNFSKHGNLPNELESRGLLDEKILPGYYARDDALKIYYALRTYVDAIIKHHYDTPEKIINDEELQQWRAELTGSSKHGCKCGFKGVPGEGDKFTAVEQLIEVFTTIIYICSVGHASVNFQQYDEYGFPPNYPSLLKGEPPMDKTPRTEKDIVSALPDQATMLDVMVVTKLLSDKGTNSLSDFEVQYFYDEVGINAKNQLKSDLNEISKSIKERNSKLKYPYDWLDPEAVPNSISI